MKTRVARQIWREDRATGSPCPSATLPQQTTYNAAFQVVDAAACEFFSDKSGDNTKNQQPTGPSVGAYHVGFVGIFSLALRI